MTNEDWDLSIAAPPEPAWHTPPRHVDLRPGSAHPSGLPHRYVGKHRKCPRHPYQGLPIVMYEVADCDAYCWTRTPTVPMDQIEEN